MKNPSVSSKGDFASDQEHTFNEKRKMAEKTKETSAGATMETRQSKWMIIQVARMGATEPATLEDVERTDHQVPKDEGGNQALRILAQAGQPAPWAETRDQGKDETKIRGKLSLVPMKVSQEGREAREG